MARGKANLEHGLSGYLERTRCPLNCLLFVLPMLLAYEAGAMYFGHRLLTVAHLNHVQDYLGVTGRFLPPLLIVAALLVWHVAVREKWRLDGWAVLGMAGESVLWMVPLLLLAGLTWKLTGGPALSANAASHPLAADILADIGAGIYEEFFFRLAAISLLLGVLVKVLRAPKGWSVAVAVVLASVAFSLYHFIGPWEFAWHLFIFRAGAGAYLAGVYLTRGFGVAVGAHACYNVISHWAFGGYANP